MKDKVDDDAIVPVLAKAEYLEFRKGQLELASYNIRTFGTTIISLSSGAFGLSLLFADRLGGMKTSAFPWLLPISWLLYAVAVMACLWSYRLGWRTAILEVEKQDTSFSQVGDFDYSPNPMRKRTNLYNNTAFMAFAAGTLVLAAFAYLNTGSP